MTGTRRDFDPNDGAPPGGIPAPGEYGKWADGWYGCTPNRMLAGLRLHDVVEHEDGTITVSPSILTTRGSTGERWHGYLERGVWREC